MIDGTARPTNVNDSHALVLRVAVVVLHYIIFITIFGAR